MVRLFFSYFLLSLLGCAADSLPAIKPNKSTEATKIGGLQTIDLFEKAIQPIKHEPYSVHFQIEKVHQGQYRLVIHLKLDRGASFLSPFSDESFVGRYTMRMEEDSAFKWADTFSENPHPNKTVDIDGKTVYWVRENTSYAYTFDRLGQEDIEVPGAIWFVIEPRCTMEVIGFVIVCKNGEFSVRQNENGC